MCCLYPGNRVQVSISASSWFQKLICLWRLLCCVIWQQNFFFLCWMEWYLQKAIESDWVLPQWWFHELPKKPAFAITDNTSAVWQDTAIHGPGSSTEAVLTYLPLSWIKALTAVQDVFPSGIHCCPRGKAGCSLCAGPRWTDSRALICPLSSPQCFPHFQSQN